MTNMICDHKNKTQQSETHPEVPQADDVVFSLEDIGLTSHRAVTTFFDEPSNPMPSNEEEAVC